MLDFDFYEELIEDEILPLVKYLRNKGINTTGSCAQEKFVVLFGLYDNEQYPTKEYLKQLVINFGYNDFYIDIEDKEALTPWLRCVKLIINEDLSKD